MPHDDAYRAQVAAPDVAAVPEPWKDAGYSGLFWARVALAPELAARWAAAGPAAVVSFREGWLLVSADPAAGTAVIVRRDEDAVLDLIAGPAAAAAPVRYALPAVTR